MKKQNCVGETCKAIKEKVEEAKEKINSKSASAIISRVLAFIFGLALIILTIIDLVPGDEFIGVPAGIALVIWSLTGFWSLK